MHPLPIVEAASGRELERRPAAAIEQHACLAPWELRRAMILAALFTAPASAAALAVSAAVNGSPFGRAQGGLTQLYFLSQDAPCLVASGILLAILAALPLSRRLGGWQALAQPRPWLTSACLAGLALVVTLATAKAAP